MRRLAARALAWGLAVVGALLGLVTAVEWVAGDVDHLALKRALLAIFLLAAAALAQRLRRRRPTQSVLVLLMGVGIGLVFTAWGMGLGVHMLALAAVGVVVAVAGPTVGVPAATAIAALYVAGVLGLALAETQGWIPGRAAAATLSVQARVMGHLMMALGGWIAALLLARVVQAAIERARAEHARVLDLLNLGSDWTWEADAALQPTYVSPSFESRTGRSVAEFMRPNQPGGPQVVADADWAALRQELRAQRAFRDLACSYRCDDGTMLVVSISGTPLLDPQGVLAGWRGVGRNITALRRAEQELAAAKLQAEGANAAKSAFLATMSHEIRTPLNGVLGLARLLQDPAVDAPRRAEYQRHLVESAELLSGIVSNVLDLSKIEAGHLQVEQIVFDLHEVVHSSFQAFAPLGQERGLAMDCQIAAGVPRHVRGDPVRVRQILGNFLGNALKFTARGAVSLAAQRRPGGRIRLSVRDTGPGVAPEVASQLFKPFAQADSSTTRRFGGTGLGLSICRELAQRMGGEVGVDSDGESGSLFWVELPLQAQAPEMPRVGGSGTEGQPLQGLRVLVAEDNAVNMLIVGAMLHRLGAQVLEAADGDEAVSLALAHAGNLHALLMDLHMPGLDGLAATRRLRDQAPTRGLPIFAFSAAVLDHERREAEAAGTDGFVTKPANEADLLRVLRPLVPARAEALPDD